MRRLTILNITMLALTSFMAITALAQTTASPSAGSTPAGTHYQKGSPSISGIDANGDVQVNFTIAGLGNNVQIQMTVSADATATFVCQNNGGNCPNAANKVTVNGPVSASGLFTSGKNGSLSGALTLEPPGSGNFSCPGQQTIILAKVTYNNITVTSSANLPVVNLGSLSRTFTTGDCAP